MSILNNKVREFTINDLVNERNYLHPLSYSFENIKQTKFTEYKSLQYSSKFKFTLATLIYEAKEYSYVSELINSFLNQTLEDVEIIILSNGASSSLIEMIASLIENSKNVRLILNSFPQYDPLWPDDKDPIIAFWNLALGLANGELFSHISWDDKVNNIYCEEIYNSYIKTGCKSIAPKVNIIDLYSQPLKKNNISIEKTYPNEFKKIDSKKIMMSRMGLIKEKVLSSPGEILVFERNHFISRSGFDCNFDINQYFKVGAGIEIALANKSKIFWRYHPNQGNSIAIKNGAIFIRKTIMVFYSNNLFSLHEKLYGVEWARKVRKFMLWNLPIWQGNAVFWVTLRLFPKKIFKLIANLFKEAGFIVFCGIIISITKYLVKKSIYYIFLTIKNPRKIFKIQKRYFISKDLF